MSDDVPERLKEKILARTNELISAADARTREIERRFQQGAISHADALKEIKSEFAQLSQNARDMVAEEILRETLIEPLAAMVKSFTPQPKETK